MPKAKVKRVNAKKLAKYLRKGSKMRDQITGDLFELFVEWNDPDTGNAMAKPVIEVGGSCALGAIFEGAFGLPDVKKKKDYKGDNMIYEGHQQFQLDGGYGRMIAQLRKKFPVLKELVDMPKSLGEDYAQTLDLDEAIIELNDDQDWSRAKIANWLEKGPILHVSVFDDEDEYGF